MRHFRASWRVTLAAVVLLTIARAASAGAGSDLLATALTVNARQQPLGIAPEAVSLGWALSSARRGVAQSAYEIRVGRRPGAADVWASGKVDSSRQLDVRLPASVPLQAAVRYHWQVRVWDASGQVGAWSRPQWFETGLVSAADWQGAAWIGAAQDRPDEARPLLRRALQIDRPVRQARLYATALGVYQFWLNGRAVGDQALAPGWTDYKQRLQVQAYDVTALVRPGANVLGAALADGWARGKVGMGWRGVYGSELALKAKLRVTYADGSQQDWGSDTDWTTHPGPWLQADLQDGEHYDERRLPQGWQQPGFDARAWVPAVRRADTPARLVPQTDAPVRATQLIRARAMHTGPDGRWIYDFGQNLVGVVRLRASGRPGQVLTLRHAEELYRRGERTGQLYTDNLRSAAAIDRYTFGREATVIYQPTFTQHGFRYVELSGIDRPPPLADVQAVVLGSDLPAIGALRLDHPLLDQLVSNIRWSARGNFLSIPTDTPARDERLGWTGDINVFAATAARLFDMRAFLSKWMDDVGDAQRPDGNVPAVVPFTGHAFGETGVGWADAVITVPYAAWQASGDTALLRRHWPTMRRFYDHVHASATADGNLLEEGRASWFSGDWLSLEGVDRLKEHPVIATAYFAEDTRQMAEMAEALGEAAQAEAWRELAGRIRQAFVQAYRAPDGRIATGTQTVYALALGLDLLAPGEERDATAARFVEKLAADGNRLKTGLLGTPWLLPALSRIGRDDLAMQLLLSDQYPSWGFEIRMGATTLWERWNSIRADGEFGPVDMNSFNHYANGAVGDWMFERLGGLQLAGAGYRRVRIAPLLSHPELAQARASLHTPLGLLESHWQRRGAVVSLDVRVPVGAQADVVLPVSDLREVREGRQPAVRAAGVLRAAWAAGQLTLRLGAGHYRFTLPAPAPLRRGVATSA